MTNSEWLSASDRIGCRLCRDARWSSERCAWLGWIPEPARKGVYDFGVLGPSFYSGAAGTALFLASLSKETGDSLQRRCAEAALRYCFDGIDGDLVGIGLYDGLAGIAYVLIRAGQILRDSEWIAKGDLLLKRLPEEPKPEWPADIISGLAGIILVQLWAARNGIDYALDRAYRCGRRLASMAQRSAAGWSWTSPASAHINLVGYSHGTSGIAAALVGLLEHFDDPFLREAAQGALDYDNAHFSFEKQNWADYRTAETEDAPEFMSGWCHGAPGIAVSRLQMRNPPPDLWVALNTTLRSVQAGHNFCLCHGLCGNADILLSAHERFPNLEYLHAATAVADRGLECFHRRDRPWNCGIEEHEDAPQLLTGVAGIGYFLLRCGNQAVPSVLTI